MKSCKGTSFQKREHFATSTDTECTSRSKAKAAKLEQHPPENGSFWARFQTRTLHLTPSVIQKGSLGFQVCNTLQKRQRLMLQ